MTQQIKSQRHAQKNIKVFNPVEVSILLQF